MDTPKFSDPDERDHRRHQLAKRLTAHGARMRMIYELTGYSRNRQSRMRQRCRVPEESRKRGPAPSAFARFFKEGVHTEASCAAVLILLYRANGYQRGAQAPYQKGDIETGERIGDAWEAFRAMFPASELDFENYGLIVRGLTTGMEIQVARCACGAAVLRDMLDKSDARCEVCANVRQRVHDGA